MDQCLDGILAAAKARVGLSWGDLTITAGSHSMRFLAVGRSHDGAYLYFVDASSDMLMALRREQFVLSDAQLAGICTVDMRPQIGPTCFGATAEYAFKQLRAYGHAIPEQPGTFRERIERFQKEHDPILDRLRVPYRTGSFADGNIAGQLSAITDHLRDGGFVLVGQHMAKGYDSRTFHYLDGRKPDGRVLQYRLRPLVPWYRLDGGGPAGDPAYKRGRVDDGGQQVQLRNLADKTTAWYPVTADLQELRVDLEHATALTGIVSDGRVAFTDPNVGAPIVMPLERALGRKDTWYLVPRVPFVPRLPHFFDDRGRMHFDLDRLASGQQVYVDIDTHRERITGEAVVLQARANDMELWMTDGRTIFVQRPFNYQHYASIEMHTTDTLAHFERVYERKRFDRLATVAGRPVLARYRVNAGFGDVIRYEYGYWKGPPTDALLTVDALDAPIPELSAVSGVTLKRR